MALALDPERWRQLRPLLDRALDLDADARVAFVEEVSTGSPQLRADLERLLARHDVTEGLSRPAAELAGDALRSARSALPEAAMSGQPRRIGPFQLIRLLGAGGMGAVYEAERIDGGFRQTVAVKLVSGIHPGLMARFERERQILAELRHPHIAQLLDGGETTDGMPYFALEFIDGQPITEFANAIDADIESRIRLMIEVAEALAYAHRRNVIHRDIKPGNIMVSADGHVKLLDFGIAKLLKDTGPTLTQQRVGPMTPEYAAPEQFHGAELSVATDVYQFGVLLFRMLSGRYPYRANADDGLAWARAVSEQEPLSLTSAIRDSRRAAQAGSLSGESSLRRFELRHGAHLDAIVRRCLAKKPAERYPGMDALIADLQRYLTPTKSPRLPARSWVAALVLLAASVTAWVWWPAATGTAGASMRDARWGAEPALTSFGLREENLHVAQPATIDLIRQAVLVEGRGDAPAALALLASAHRSDPKTPVPALLSSYWISGLGRAEERLEWRQQADRRVAQLTDPYIDLLSRFLDSDSRGETENSLRYSAAMLELHPEAWFLHLARAHALYRRDLRAAALKELQAIHVPRLGHRKLVDAIADRGSLGDLTGAWAQFHSLEVADGDPEHTALRARLAYSSGDLAGARDLYALAVEQARSSARFDIEARAQLWAGVFSAALGDYPRAEAELRLAQERLSDRAQYGYAADASVALAQIAAMRANAPAVRTELDRGRELLANVHEDTDQLELILVDARLTGSRPELPDRLQPDAAVLALVRARMALQDGDLQAAGAALEESRIKGIARSPYVEEAAWLARSLDAPDFDLPPIDPPFAPYARYVARCGLGQGGSIAPAPNSAVVSP